MCKYIYYIYSSTSLGGAFWHRLLVPGADSPLSPLFYQVHSLQDASASTGVQNANGWAGEQQQGQPGASVMRAPKWLRRPCGATFGFGGKLARFSNINGAVVTVSDVHADHGVVQRAEELHAALDAGDLAGFCERKVEGAATERDADDWRLMQVLCSQDQRQLLLGFLGLADPNAPKPPDSPVAAPGAGGEEDPEPPPPPPAPTLEDEDPAALFSQMAVATERQMSMVCEMPSSPVPSLPSRGSSSSIVRDSDAAAGAAPAAGPLVTAAAPDDPGVARAVLNGNFETAVEVCLSQGRVADALVLAAAGGRELWAATRDKYLSSNSSAFLSRLSAITHQNFGSYVAQSALEAWKETLGLVNTYASAEELPALCDQLGARLEQEASDAAAATLCYMCAANTAKAVELWRARYEEAMAAPPAGDENAPLLELMEKCVVFQETTQTKEGYLLISDKLTAFAELLSAQGCLHEAMGYLVQLPPAAERDDPAAMLMHRIHGANPNLLASPPPVPFDEVHVPEQGEAAQPQQAGYGAAPNYATQQPDYGAAPQQSAYANGTAAYGQANGYGAAAPVPVPAYDAGASAYGGYSAQPVAAAPPGPYSYAAAPAASYEAAQPAPSAGGYGAPATSSGGYGYTTPAAPPPAAAYAYQAPPAPAAAPAAASMLPSSYQPAPAAPPPAPFQYQAPAQTSYAAPPAAAYGAPEPQAPQQQQAPPAPPPAPARPSYDASGVVSTMRGLMGLCGAYQLQVYM